MIEQTKARERHCDREFLQLFMEGELSLDDELTFLVHLWMTADHAGILSTKPGSPETPICSERRGGSPSNWCLDRSNHLRKSEAIR